jgi:hypothetical protein
MQPAPSSVRSPEFMPVFGRLVPSTSVPSEEFDAVLLSVPRPGGLVEKVAGLRLRREDECRRA